MKNSKKIVALVLAMVMIFALTASALAATNSADSTITVKVTIRGILTSDQTNITPVCTNEVFTITENSTVYNLVQTMSDLGSTYAHDAVWKTVDLVDEDGNATGGTGKALTSLSCNTANTTDGIYGYYTWSGHSSTTKTLNTSGVFTYYDCEYQGINWTYSVTPEGGTTVTPDVYMDSYVLHNDDTVTLTYLASSETWTAFEP